VNPEKWEQMKGLFATALERDPGERAEFLQKACGENEALRAEVERLLRSYELNKSVSIGEAAETDEFAGRKIGPYQLIRKIGTGGMGAVYLGARADDTFNKRVAIKLVRADVDTQAVLRRFRQERQILAPLDHPNITRLLDGGTTEQGLPYFVMDYVEGTRIDRYCDSHKLSINERIKLFREVCSAVQYVHQNLVVHRDLKPGNILVTAEGVPKLLDFGIAKLLKPEFFTSALDATMAEFRPMTPGYASPEQVRGEPVTTASDVYSLGVILYELLTSCRPYKLKGDNPEEIRHAVCEQEPDKPSVTLTQFQGAHTDDAGDGPTSARKKSLTAESIAAKRATVPEKLRRQLSGDLDVIVLKALRKEPQRRYSSVAQLSEDLGRHLEGLPVMAHRDTRSYRAGKFIRRHKVGVAAASILVLLLAGFAGIEAMQLRLIARERDRANRITGFMTGMFKVSNPSEARGNSITAREILDKASGDINAGLAKDPEQQAQMMYVMGTVYDNLGIYSQADTLLRRAADIQGSVLGKEDADTLTSLLALGSTLRHEGHYAEAEGLDRQVLEIRQRRLGPQNPDTVTAMANLGVDLNFEGHYADAEKLQRQALALRLATLGRENADTAASMDNLALVLQMEARYADAEKMDREAIDIRRRVLGPDHPDTVGAMSNLANVLWRQERYPEAEQMNREVLAARIRVYGPENPVTLKTMSNLANVLHREGKDADAERLCRQTLDTQRRVLGPEHPETLMSMNNLTAILNKEGNYAEAEQLGREVLDIRRRILGPEHPLTLRAMTNLSDTLAKRGNWGEAQKLLQQALEAQRRVLGPDYPDTALSVYNLACVVAHQGKPTQALAMLRDSLDHGLPAWIAQEMGKDPDLNVLHSDPRFATLVAYANQRATAAQKPSH
jgi:eukaryotic-like serine/threonine-protein kinase